MNSLKQKISIKYFKFHLIIGHNFDIPTNLWLLFSSNQSPHLIIKVQSSLLLIFEELWNNYLQKYHLWNFQLLWVELLVYQVHGYPKENKNIPKKQ